ncbi:MAG TPA: M23 family metallopeptidase [Acidimicrobiia bacterium]|nr:M23 family metallopeptidase [Acidimicrobiia bacterium]
MILLPSPSAAATEEPPFEIRFPQETSVTVFASTFGDRRSGGRRHHGIDLMAPKMTRVYAAADGYIARIETHSLAGRYIEIAHAEGWTTKYVHLNNDTPGTDDGAADWSLTLAPGVRLGAWVEAGQMIAWVGDSGNAESSGSHTHFELDLDGDPIDPYLLLKVAWQRDRDRYQADIRDSRPPVDNHLLSLNEVIG